MTDTTLTAAQAIDALRAASDPAKAVDMAAYHKVDRPYLGCPMPALNDLVRDWRSALTLAQRIDLAAALWDTNIHEARVTAAKLLIQARMRPDDAAAWALIETWVPQFDGWAVADHVASAGGRRIMADLSRLDTLETWTTSDHLWTKRAALVMTLPLTKLNHLSAEQLVARDRVLRWAADYVGDPQWFVQKAVAWWLRELSKHDADAVRGFLEAHGSGMKAFARKEAARLLPPA
ncbi:DNA alkylation repair protein [Sagittula sp. SSi028]|uniref:DNA alkylation repair protein n=1 Tax=Sagittula sp. SSi028 TaxID=3400636 RepID=UPI003AF95792